MWRKRQMDGNRLPARAQVAQTLALPVNVAENLPQIELLGDREAVIEHCQGVLEYSDERVRIRCGPMVLQINGRGLLLKYMTGESIMVTGRFSELRFAHN